MLIRPGKPGRNYFIYPLYKSKKADIIAQAVNRANITGGAESLENQENHKHGTTVRSGLCSDNILRRGTFVPAGGKQERRDHTVYKRALHILLGDLRHRTRGI
jgi:hypothetical protein